MKNLANQEPIRVSGCVYSKPVGKRLERATDGSTVKTALLDERSNAAETITEEFATAAEMFDHICKADAHTMFFSGTFAPGVEGARLLPIKAVPAARAYYGPETPVVAATKDYLAFREGPGVLRIDIDPKPQAELAAVHPDAEPFRLETHEEVCAALTEVLPEANECPILIRASASSMIVDESGKTVKGPGGWRVYIPVDDAREIPRLLDVLHLRCWVQDVFRFAFLSAGGSVLFRSIADQAFTRPTQPDYPRADLGPGLKRASDADVVYINDDDGDGPLLVTASVVISDEDRDLARTHMNKAQQALTPQKEKLIAGRIREHTGVLMAKGVPREAAERAALQRFEAGVLISSDVVTLDDGEVVSVASLLSGEGRTYDGRGCFDPVEPDYGGGRPVCKIFLNDGQKPVIHSFAHGSKVYQLKHDNETAVDAAGDADRPLITVRAGRLHTLATEAEKALIAGNAQFYAHGNTIKRPVIDEVEASKGRKTKVARLTEATVDTIRDHLSRVARWQKFDGRANKDVPTDPPRDVAATVLSRDGERLVPSIVGVITTQTLRPDGTILSEPGYDSATRLILIDPPKLRAISERPSRSEALTALSTLDGLLSEFPFADAASRSVALSGLITPVVRGALPVAPMHVINAPEAGSGKSYIVDVASVIASGQRCPVMAAGRTEEETEKRLGAALMKGQALISIDNLNGELSGDALCQFIERPVNEVRVLGQSKNVRIESRSTMFATGNNIKIVGDIVRRSITCSLDPNTERPELRQFKADPFEMVLADRGHYVAAALTVVRAYIVAGCPNTLPALGSFGDWSRLVRSALVWLGRADPVDTMEAARADDPKKNQLRQVVAAWREAVQREAARPNAASVDKPLTTAGLKELAEKKGTIGGYKLDHASLHAMLLEVAGVPGRGEIDTLKLGKWLGQQSGRVVDGLKITSARDPHAKQKLWCLAERGGE